MAVPALELIGSETQFNSMQLWIDMFIHGGDHEYVNNAHLKALDSELPDGQRFQNWLYGERGYFVKNPQVKEVLLRDGRIAGATTSTYMTEQLFEAFSEELREVPLIFSRDNGRFSNYIPCSE